jgi:hypothetical protein
MVSLSDHWIETPPHDAQLVATLQRMQLNPGSSAQIGNTTSELIERDGQKILRSVFPSVATSQKCVDCHNALQPGKHQWQLREIMGAYVVDRKIGGALIDISWASAWYGVNTESASVVFNRHEINYTVSIGLVTVKQSDPFESEGWIGAADKLLYRAKNSGRNRTCAADEFAG